MSYSCPCCGYATLFERGGYDTCFVCDWEDDGQDDPKADAVLGGPNYYLSLSQARANFRDHLFAQDPARDHRARLMHALAARDVVALKQQIIAAFEELLISSSHEEQQDLWNRIDDLNAELFHAVHKGFGTLSE